MDETKIESAIKILHFAEIEARKHDEPVEIAYSGGKDSDVLLQLAKESGIDFVAIYKNTTIDPKGTIQHCREMGATIIQPKLSFFKLIERRGFPSFTRRFCCENLKEYKIMNVACVGVRQEESQRRAARYKTFEQCRVYANGSKVRQFYPIYNWTLQDLKDYIESRKLRLAAPYYDESGNIDYSRRLGCMGCPLPASRSVDDFKSNPALTRAWLKAGQVWFSKRAPKAEYFYKDAVDLFIMLVFYRSAADYKKDFFNSDGSRKRNHKSWLWRQLGYKLKL